MEDNEKYILLNELYHKKGKLRKELQGIPP
jgi:hypothetical protein